MGEIFYIPSVHTDDVVVFSVVARRDLRGPVRHDGDPHLPQLLDGASVGRIAELLGAGRHGVDQKFVRKPKRLHLVGKNALGHRASANVAVAAEQYANHRCHLFGI